MERINTAQAWIAALVSDVFLFVSDPTTYGASVVLMVTGALLLAVGVLLRIRLVSVCGILLLLAATTVFVLRSFAQTYSGDTFLN